MKSRFGNRLISRFGDFTYGDDMEGSWQTWSKQYNVQPIDLRYLRSTLLDICGQALEGDYTTPERLQEILFSLAETNIERWRLERDLVKAMIGDAQFERRYEKQKSCVDCGNAVPYGLFKHFAYHIDVLSTYRPRCVSCQSKVTKAKFKTCSTCGERYRDEKHPRGPYLYFKEQKHKCNVSTFYPKERKRIRENNRRTIRLDEPGTLEYYEWIETLEHFNHSCAYCGGKFEVLEHFIPVGYGAGTTKSNCVPSCHSCNTSKRDLHPILDGLPFPDHIVANIIDYLDGTRLDDAS